MQRHLAAVTQGNAVEIATSARPERVWSAGQCNAVPEAPAICVIELAPGHGRQVAAPGVEISRNYLLRILPARLISAEHIRLTLNRPSLLEGVAPDDECHCALHWNHGWQLVAHRPVVCGQTVYENGARLDLPRSTAIVLGIGGWPLVIRIDETFLPL